MLFTRDDFSIFSTIMPDYYHLSSNGPLDIGVQELKDGAKISLSYHGAMRLFCEWLEQLDDWQLKPEDKRRLTEIIDKK